mmetsp:Transcript_36501/g.77645  ORF Transcript_36501/g.77645 Transcript_36501/m.77645 type:complete len:258 (-) Transcript_36501:146-919(-)
MARWREDPRHGRRLQLRFLHDTSRWTRNLPPLTWAKSLQDMPSRRCPSQVCSPFPLVGSKRVLHLGRCRRCSSRSPLLCTSTSSNSQHREASCRGEALYGRAGPRPLSSGSRIWSGPSELAWDARPRPSEGPQHSPPASSCRLEAPCSRPVKEGFGPGRGGSGGPRCFETEQGRYGTGPEHPWDPTCRCCRRANGSLELFLRTCPWPRFWWIRSKTRKLPPESCKKCRFHHLSRDSRGSPRARRHRLHLTNHPAHAA